MTATPAELGRKSAVSQIVTVSLIIIGLVVAALTVLSISTAGVFALIGLLFTALFFVFALGAWRGKRWGFLGGAILSIVISLLFGNPADTLYNPADSSFPFSFALYVAAIVAIIYGAYGFYTAKRSSVTPRQIPRSSIFALIALGIAIGGLLVGSFAGVTQNMLLSTHGQRVDVTIVLGAASLGTRAFNPDNYTVKVGTTVAWFNRDTTIHTVTSTTSAFDSGDIASGATWPHTFTQTGTFQYYCAIHPDMKGTIVVTS